MNIPSLQGSGRTHFVVIMSDNGAEGQLLKVILVLAGATVNDVCEKYYDNLIDNKVTTILSCHTALGGCKAPSRCAKFYSTEGAIRCTCIVRCSQETNLAPRIVTLTCTTVMNILPTVLGVQHPEKEL